MAAADGTYDQLELQQIDDATYEDVAKTKKEKDLQKMQHSDRRRYKRALVGAGLLCGVLVLLNIAVPLYLNQSNMVGRDHWNNTLTENTFQARFEQLMTRYTLLTEEREQTQTSFTKEKGQLQTSVNTLTKEKGQLQTSVNTLTREKGQLQTSVNTLIKEKGQLQTSVNTLTKEKGQLQTSVNTLTKDKQQVQTNFDQLQNRQNQLTRQKEQLQTSFDLLKETCDRLTCQESGWQKFGSSCYHISTGTNNWDGSRQWCVSRQSDLIVINSREEQDFVDSFNKRVWLGLTDRDIEGSFQWVDGTPLTTPTYWIPGQPLGESKEYPNAVEDCVEHYDGSQSDYPSTGWNDSPCSSHINWICERVL